MKDNNKSHNQKSPEDSGRDFFNQQNEFNDNLIKRLDALEECFEQNFRVLSASVAAVWGFLIEDDLATSAELEALATNALTVMDKEGTLDPRNLFDEQTDAPIQFDREEFERLVKPLIEFLQTKCHPHMSVIVEYDRASLVEDVKSVPFKVPVRATNQSKRGEKMQIDFEIISENVSYESVQKLIKKICEDHQQDELHITVKLSGVYVSESESLSDDKVS